MDELCDYFSILLRYKIVSDVSVMCPGNDTFGKQVRAHTKGHLGGFDSKQTPVPNKRPVSELETLSAFFHPILWKRIKGNFIIKTLDDGTIDRDYDSDAFSDLKSPIVLGQNLLLSSPDRAV